MTTMLRFKGSQHFRQRLVLATLSGRAVRINAIRERDSSPGLRDYEASLLRLLEKCTNGCVVEINETGARCRRRWADGWMDGWMEGCTHCRRLPLRATAAAVATAAARTCLLCTRVCSLCSCA